VRRWMRRTLYAMIATAGGAIAATAQQTAGAAPGRTVIGQVVNAETKAPLPDVMVLVTGTKLGSTTNADGRFIIRGVPAGAQTVRAQLLGYAPQEQSVTVAEDAPATVNFALKSVPYTLGPVVVTASALLRLGRVRS